MSQYDTVIKVVDLHWRNQSSTPSIASSSFCLVASPGKVTAFRGEKRGVSPVYWLEFLEGRQVTNK